MSGTAPEELALEWLKLPLTDRCCKDAGKIN
jgi:hypothetical protein